MRTKYKTTLIFAVLFASVFVAPGLTTVNAQSSVPGGWNFSFNSDNASQMAGMPSSLANSLGGIFSVFGQLGPSGAALGQVFSILFQNIMNFSVQDSLIQGVYTLNATYQSNETIPGVDFSNSTGSNTYFVYKPVYNETTWNNTQWGYAYFNKTGTANLDHTYGASIVFIIWDHDGSLINALQRVVDAFHQVKNELEMYGNSNTWTAQEQQEVYNTIANEVLNAVTYFLIHINDIITGDELIVTNIITWDTYNLETSSNYQVIGDFKVASNPNDVNPATDPSVSNTTVQDWNKLAVQNNDSYMIWLTTQVMLAQNQNVSTTTHWSRFSFNIVELWLKSFQIHINVSAIVDGLSGVLNSQGGSQGSSPFSDMGLAQIFQGLNIEVYLITHSLLGFIAFNDTNHNGVPDIIYKDVNQNVTNSANNGTQVVSSQVPVGSEAVDYFALGNIGNVVFNQPTVTSDGKGIKWSVRLNNLQMFAVPIGANPQDIRPVYQNMSFIQMGFTFTPTINDLVNTSGYVNSSQEATVRMGAGVIKLNQEFSQWNNGNGPAPDSNLAGLGLSVIFVSTILHFHINFQVQNLKSPTDTSKMYQQQGLLKNSSYYQADGTIKVGNYAGDLPVAAINIAGPNYTQTSNTENTTYAAKTNTIPLAFLDFNAKADVQNVNTQSPQKSFSANGYLNVSASIMLYAVSYPTWNGTGDGIFHDPTFSVFMTWNNPQFWAVILVIGSITLVGVAAIVITRRKNRV